MNSRAYVNPMLALVVTVLFSTVTSANILISPKAQRASEKAIQYLVEKQAKDGAWHSGDQGAQYPGVLTSLSGLALLSAGITPSHPQHGERLTRAGKYLVKHARGDGLLATQDSGGRSMYGHGFAMLFLAQLAGTGLEPQFHQELMTVLQRAANYTARAQSVSGGWYYTPSRQLEEGSITITQAQGLRACHNIGVSVPGETMSRALTYLEACAGKDGGMLYSLSHKSRGNQRSLPAISAAAVATLYAVGQHDSQLNKRLLVYLKKIHQKHLVNPLKAFGGHGFYGIFYMTQAMWMDDDEAWRLFYPALRQRLVAQQRRDGSWQGDRVGPVYGTAIALFCLQVPNGFLPILQR